jgi:hypothetical protein
MGFLEQIDGKDLMITFVIATVAGILYVFADQYVLAKVETAVGIPAGTW